MRIEVVAGRIEEQPAQAIVVNLFEGTTSPGGATGAVDRALGGQIQAIIEAGDFKGKRDEMIVLYPPKGALPAQRVLVVGLGKPEKFTLDGVRYAAAVAARKARALGVTHVHTVMHGAGAGGIEPRRAAEAVVEGTLLGLYRFRELKTERDDDPPDVEALTLVEFDAAQVEAMREGARVGRIIAESTMLARDLSNRPANIATPAHIAQVARQVAEETGLRYRLLDKAKMEALGMHLLLSVNQGGGEPAQMVILEHNAESDLPTVALVGKGITFDSGGISLKSGSGMARMKGDMSGAAAVLGAMVAVAQLDLPLRVIGLMPLTENMPDAHATKPGDVFRSLKGLTVEVINTDAEGRLILADALTYAGEFHPDAILDIATLTGARSVALGAHAAAVLGDERLIARLREAGETTRERVWPLPLFEEYGEQLKSEVADLKNVGGRPAGVITAAYFLSRFVPDGVPWAHLDIAGLDAVDKDKSYRVKGATGFGVRLFVETLRHWEPL